MSSAKEGNMQENAFKVSLLFPLVDNEGNPFEEEIWDSLYNKLFQLFRGFTEPGIAKGWWLGHSDLNRMIFIVVPTEEEIEQIKDLARWARTQFRQDAMYFECQRIYFEEIE